jgi:hypothetical protein
MQFCDRVITQGLHPYMPDALPLVGQGNHHDIIRQFLMSLQQFAGSVVLMYAMLFLQGHRR